LKETGGKILTGGHGDVKERWIEPTIVDSPDPNSNLMKEEIFGPILPVLPYKTADDAINFINSRPKPLGLYYFGNILKDVIFLAYL
jgi:aldehyde dehydrogenase (NAD+)